MDASTPLDAEIGALVEPNRVHRRVYTDPELFDLEMDRIFGRTWLFVAHESQVSAPGDFLRTRLGREEVLVTRDQAGAIHVVLNRCAHRGAAICTSDRGNAPVLTCPYHGWSFKLDGALDSIPFRKSMPDDFDFEGGTHALARAPRVASYRGFVFASLAAEGTSLAQHLGEMTDIFDNFVDRAPDGEITQEGGIFRQVYRGNWKLHHENANDVMHAGFTHNSSVSVARAEKRDYSEPAFDDHLNHIQLLTNGFGDREWQNTGVWTVPGGHSYMAGIHEKGTMDPDDPDPVNRDHCAQLAARVGNERAAQIMGMNRYNNLIWPNLNVNAQHQQLRVVHPIAPGLSEVHAMCFRLHGVPDRVFQRAVRILNNISSPASMIITDDIEVFERTQRGLNSAAAEWIDFSRGRDTDNVFDDGAGSSAGSSAGASDLPMRGQYAAWLEHMKAA